MVVKDRAKENNINHFQYYMCNTTVEGHQIYIHLFFIHE